MSKHFHSDFLNSPPPKKKISFHSRAFLKFHQMWMLMVVKKDLWPIL